MELARSQTDKVLPFIVSILPLAPLPKLCDALSWSALVKIAAFETEGPRRPVHAAITRFVGREQRLDHQTPMGWQSRLYNTLLGDYQERGDDRPELTFVVPVPESWKLASSPIDVSIGEERPHWEIRWPAPLSSDENDDTLQRKTGQSHSRKLIGVHNLKNAQRDAPAAKIANAEQFAFTLLITGGHFIQQQQIFAFLNIVIPGKAAFYEAQPRICEELIAWAHISCAYWREQMAEECAVSFDGSWSQRRRALHCFGAFIDPHQSKVVDFDIVERNHELHP
jgi:hypothetical protein